MKFALISGAVLFAAACILISHVSPDQAAGQTTKTSQGVKKDDTGVTPAPVKTPPPAVPQANIDPKIAALVAKLAEVCSAGKADEAGALFSENGELVDETGRVYEGRPQISGILGELLTEFPGARFTMIVEGVRELGQQTFVVDAIQQVSTSDGVAESRQRVVAIVVETEGELRIGSLREYADPEIQTPALQLKPLEWLVGDWIDEARTGDVLVSCRWSEDGNYLLRTFNIRAEGKVRMRSTQRIGWDPVQKQIRAWHFDSDGSFGESIWSQVGDQWLVRATSTLADGRNGSAMHILTPGEGNTINWRSTFRIVGDVFEPDRESVMVRQPPKAGEAPKAP